MPILLNFSKIESPIRFGYSGRANAAEYQLTPRSTSVSAENGEKQPIEKFIKDKEKHRISMLTPGSKETSYWFVLANETTENSPAFFNVLKLLYENPQQTIDNVENGRLPGVRYVRPTL